METKDQISAAYLKLLAEQDAREISVTELAQTAGVSRMTFYRHFSSKEEVLAHYLGSVLWRPLGNAVDRGLAFWSLAYGRLFFSLMKEYAAELLVLERRGFAPLVLDSFNEKVGKLVADSSAPSSPYDTALASGAAYGMAFAWLHNGCREPADEMAAAFALFARKVSRSV